MNPNIVEMVDPFRVGKSSVQFEVDSITALLHVTPCEFRPREAKVLEATDIHGFTEALHLPLWSHSSI